MGSGQMPAEAGFPALNAQAALYCYISIKNQPKTQEIFWTVLRCASVSCPTERVRKSFRKTSMRKSGS